MGEGAGPLAHHREQHEPLEEYTDAEDSHPPMQRHSSEVEMSRRDLYLLSGHLFKGRHRSVAAV
jgi:hypothetical protein